jgi:hypothetical protein
MTELYSIQGGILTIYNLKMFSDTISSNLVEAQKKCD